ncbi:TPA: hypothetical protein N0F65_001783 [Lagenidium giganteum]|uniref:Ras-GAP domain-containing protein n=1 Tax=Lagenidium giganteum TaxID=4803 RepID=A0AAV2Z7I8_9STRA|nr:TPA: hypothetical protein N0F65_001783 [Lagenidium giganteum]
MDTPSMHAHATTGGLMGSLRMTNGVTSILARPVLEPPDLKFPELWLTGVDLQKRNVHMQMLHKKVRPCGKRFESAWRPYYVGVYAHMLFYYERLEDLPVGIVPLVGCMVKPVDRIFKNASEGEDWSESFSEECGPCWKLTSRAGRVFLFRSPTFEFRNTWMDMINEANVEHPLHRNLVRQKPPADHSRASEKREVEAVPEVSEMLRDAMLLVKKQKQEISELKRQMDEQKEMLARAEHAAASAAAMATAASGTSSPNSQERGRQMNSDFIVPVSSSNLARRASFDITDNEYLQQQAMELAEIARNLQSSFQADATVDIEFADSGLLDSIHKVMKDFIQETQPVTRSQPMIISDEIIAQINRDMNGDKEDVDEISLRGSRSRSSCDDLDAGRLRSFESLSMHSRTKSANEIDVSAIGDFLMQPRDSLPGAKDFATLVTSNNMAVAGAILQTASRDEKMSLLFPLLRLFASRNKLSRLIRWAIEIEVASVVNVATLFRSDDYASRIVSTYSKSIGTDYIKVVLKKPLRTICTLKISDVELAGDLIPKSYFHVCYHLNEKVIKRFDGSMEGIAFEDPVSLTRSVIGGFLFLRFVCPAITTPHLYDLVAKEPSADTRRVLVLVTKLLFKTATCVMFGDREPQFRILNPFIQKNAGSIQKLYTRLSVAPTTDIDSCFASDSKNIFASVPAKQIEKDVEAVSSFASLSVGMKHTAAVEEKLRICGASPQTIENFKSTTFSVEKEVENFLVQKIQKSRKLNMNFLGFGKKPRKVSDA